MSRKNTRRKAKPVIDPSIRPTPERLAANDHRSDGMATRITPVIDTLRDTGKLTAAQYDALAYYREQAHKAEDDAALQSPLSAERIMRGIPAKYYRNAPCEPPTGFCGHNRDGKDRT